MVNKSDDEPITRTRVVIVGSGFAGLGMAIKLTEAGITDFVVLERGPEVGGTWRDNTYPGAACDVPSNLYSFSFAPNPNWTRAFSPQPEIQQYLVDCADRYGIRPKVRFGHTVDGCDWDEDEQAWRVSTDHGTFVGQLLVSATGSLSDPSLPAIPGIDTFAGTTFHSARWDHDHDLAGERVAVIGTGASAIQFVPQIQPEVAKLTLFQRTPPWVMPRRDRAFTALERRLFKVAPFTQRLRRLGIYWGHEAFVAGFIGNPRLMRGASKLALAHMHKAVGDPVLRKKLTPDYRMGCKRVLISNDYYPALAQPNVEVETGGIAEVRPHSIVTADGVEHEVDTIIFGTGFHVTDMPATRHIRGVGGVALMEHWSEGMDAHKGTTVPGYPNFFVIPGPNTGTGTTSQVFMIESQIAYVMDAIRELDARGAAEVEVDPAAEQAWNDDVQRRMQGTVWTSGGCKSWYLDARGRNTVLWPNFTWRFRLATRRFDPAAYRFRARRSTPVEAPPERVAQTV